MSWKVRRDGQFASGGARIGGSSAEKPKRSASTRKSGSRKRGG